MPKRVIDESDSDFDVEPSPSPAAGTKKKKKRLPSSLAPKPDDGAMGGAGSPTSPSRKKKDPPMEYGVDLTAADQAPELTDKYSAMKNDELKAWLKVRLERCRRGVVYMT